MSDQITQLSLEEALQPPEMLCPDPLIVRLNKAFSWQQSPSHLPYYLSRAQQGRAYSKDEIVEQIFGDTQSYHQEPQEKGWLSSIYSLRIDRQHQEIVIEGIGLFERVDGIPDRFRISADGLLLAHAYSADRASDNWKRVFADILARNDVRVHCVLLHLARWQCLLVFRDGVSEEAFFLPGKGGALRMADGTEHPLFETDKGKKPANSFTLLLQRDPHATLGPFLSRRIEQHGIRIPEDVAFEGGRTAIRNISRTFEEPSVNHLRDYMKQALSLFRDIGALVYVPHRQGWTLDRERCVAVFDPEVASDLFGGTPESRFLDVLATTYRKFSDADGLVRVADIRDFVCDELDIPTGERIAYFNQQAAYYLRPDVGKLSIGRTFHHQAGPSECLFGDLALEYVEFIFAPS